jgi:hypothetical protein
LVPAVVPAFPVVIHAAFVDVIVAGWFVVINKFPFALKLSVSIDQVGPAGP